jgi:hypothetical protein
MRTGRFISILVLIAVAATAWGIEVDRDEITSVNPEKVNFINYEGPHAFINTRDEIVGIGRRLGTTIGEEPATVRFYGKYRVIHVVEPEEAIGFDADVYIIEPEAEVDHVNNVRLMLSGYLQSAYDYSEQDSALLAEYVTYYNAIYRGDMGYLREKYKDAVMQHVAESNVGIAVVYSDWPGNTRMLIPLTGVPVEGRLGTLDSEELANREVTEELRQREDRGVEPRKGMVELQEREVDEAREELDEREEVLEQEEQQLEEERRQIDEEREEAAAELETEEDDQRIAAIEEEEAERDEREEELEAREDEIQEERQEIEEERQAVEEREDRLAEERERIAEDEREIIAEEEAEEEDERVAQGPQDEGAQPETARPDLEQTVHFLQIFEREGEPLGQIVRFDPRNGERLAGSALNSIRGREYYTFNDHVLVVAGRTNRGGAVRLMLLDRETLDTATEADQDVFHDTAVLVREDAVYAVVNDGGGTYLGRFGQDLELEARSEEAVTRYTTVRYVAGRVYVQAASGEILGLAPDDLSVVATVGS